MSIVVETFLSCDGENASRHCIGQFGVDNRHLTGAQHRNDAKLEGWKLIKGKDICPECYKVIKENNKQP